MRSGTSRRAERAVISHIWGMGILRSCNLRSWVEVVVGVVEPGEVGQGEEDGGDEERANGPPKPGGHGPLDGDGEVDIRAEAEGSEGAQIHHTAGDGGGVHGSVSCSA